MKNIIKQYIDYRSLAPLIVVNKRFEETAEVFRCQPKVNFVITFQEYLKFIQYELGENDYLATKTSELKTYLRLYRQDLYRANAELKLFSSFLADIALAIGKELWYAENQGKVGTNITHEVVGGKILSDEDIEQHFVGTKVEVKAQLFLELENKGYNFVKQISAENMHLFKYAVVAKSLSLNPSEVWSYIID